MKPELIAVENISWVWPLIHQRLESAIQKIGYVEHSLQDIYNSLQRQQAQLWMTEDAKMIAITRIERVGETKRLCVDFIQGADYGKYFDAMEYIEAWARSHGATQAKAEMRPGLAKEVKKLGWNRQRVLMFKELTKAIH